MLRLADEVKPHHPFDIDHNGGRRFPAFRTAFPDIRIRTHGSADIFLDAHRIVEAAGNIVIPISVAGGNHSPDHLAVDGLPFGKIHRKGKSGHRLLPYVTRNFAPGTQIEFVNVKFSVSRERRKRETASDR